METKILIDFKNKQIYMACIQYYKEEMCWLGWKKEVPLGSKHKNKYFHEIKNTF